MKIINIIPLKLNFFFDNIQNVQMEIDGSSHVVLLES